MKDIWGTIWKFLVGNVLSMGSHRVGHDWSDLAAAVCEIIQWSMLLIFPLSVIMMLWICLRMSLFLANTFWSCLVQGHCICKLFKIAQEKYGLLELALTSSWEQINIRNFANHCYTDGLKLVWNQSWWESLHHRDWHVLHLGLPLLPPETGFISTPLNIELNFFFLSFSFLFFFF